MRSVPSLASNARPDCAEPPRYWPQERRTAETHWLSRPNCGAFTLFEADGAAGIAGLETGVACGFPALSASVERPRIARIVTAAFQITLFIVAPPKTRNIVECDRRAHCVSGPRTLWELPNRCFSG